MNCDLCGKNSELFKARIENAIMNVCSKCSKFGEVIERVIEVNENKVVKNKIEEELIELIKEGYGLIIKKAREKLGLTQEELAKKINEKASLIHKLENELIEPSLELAEKLEKFLKIKLIEYYKDKKDKLITSGSGKMTIGDLLNAKSE